MTSHECRSAKPQGPVAGGEWVSRSPIPIPISMIDPGNGHVQPAHSAFKNSLCTTFLSYADFYRPRFFSINVGGAVFTTTVATLTQGPN